MNWQWRPIPLSGVAPGNRSKNHEEGGPFLGSGASALSVTRHPTAGCQEVFDSDAHQIDYRGLAQAFMYHHMATLLREMRDEIVSAPPGGLRNLMQTSFVIIAACLAESYAGRCQPPHYQ